MNFLFVLYLLFVDTFVNAIYQNVDNNFEILESNDNNLTCKIHIKKYSSDTTSAKNLAIREALIKSIKKTSTTVFFQNDSSYADTIQQEEFDNMLKAIKSFRIENENMADEKLYEADFIIVIDRKILSINSFNLLQNYLKKTSNKANGTNYEEVEKLKSTAVKETTQILDITSLPNSIHVMYRNNNAISKWLNYIKNKFDNSNIKYNLKEMSSSSLTIEIISDNMNITAQTLKNIGFSIQKQNDTLILTEIGI